MIPNIPAHIQITVLKLGGGSLRAVLADLLDFVRSEGDGALPSGSAVVLDVSEALRMEQPSDFSGIRAQLSENGMLPLGIVGGSPKQVKAARTAFLWPVDAALSFDLASTSTESPDRQSALYSPKDRPEPHPWTGSGTSATHTPDDPAAVASVPQTEEEPDTALARRRQATQTMVHFGRVRTGQQLYARNTSLVLAGSSVPGSELIADGDIHVWGALQGRVIAGASGDTTARIFCDGLAAELVSIAGVFLTADDFGQRQGRMIISLDGDALKFDIIDADRKI